MYAVFLLAPPVAIRSMVADDRTYSTREIEKLRALGVKISIDDFGTGYWTLSHLKMLPVDSVKIDRSFIRDLKESSQGAISLVRAIITLAHGLNLKVVGEGVEKEEQVRILTHLNCDLIQGFLFCKPLNVDSAGEIFEQNARDRNDTRKQTVLCEQSAGQIQRRHSERSAWIGSTREARHAGITHATTAVKSRQPTIPATTSGS